MPWIGVGLFGSPRADGFDTCRPFGRQQGGCGDKSDEYRTCDEVGSSIEGGTPNNTLCMVCAATIAAAMLNAAPEPAWLLKSVLYGVVAGPGASTPKYLVILNLGGGTSAASRSINSIGS
jgi:hypothetical protein